MFATCLKKRDVLNMMFIMLQTLRVFSNQVSDPAAHGSQVSLPTAPLNVPAGHSSHAAAPAAALNDLS